MSAAAVIIHSLFRNKERIETSEFKNVIGRAGRAYVDVEGLVLYPIFDNVGRRLQQWEGLIADLSAREMESGLVRLVITLLMRMHRRTGGNLEQLVQYVLNNAEAWSFPEVANESIEDRERAHGDWDRHVATLDTAILSLIGENDIPDDGIAAALDNILESSLWERRLARRSEDDRQALKAALLSRSQLIWSQSTAARRRGYFLAGIGLKTGHALDTIAAEANLLLVQANAALLIGNFENAITLITSIAERVFAFYPFTPDVLPTNWKAVLRAWLFGEPLATTAAGQEAETLQFVEGGLIYRLPWAMEAIRVRAAANGDLVGASGLSLDDYELGLAVPATETGTMNRSASILIQAGFNSRLAAIKAVTDTGAVFSTAQELNQWLASEQVAVWSTLPDWPTVETKVMWTEFARGYTPSDSRTWAERRYWAWVAWQNVPPPPGVPLRLFTLDGQPATLSTCGLRLGVLQAPLNPNRRGLLRASVSPEADKVDLIYLGPDDLWLV